VFQVQTQIASRVAGALGVALGTQDQERLTERPTENLAAWDLYLKARAVTGGDAASLRLAIQYNEQAVALDSSFVQAWAALAARLSILYNNSVPDPAVGARARAAAERAIRLDPKSADAHNALIVHSMAVAKDHARARQLLEVALRDAPNDPMLLSRAASVEKSSGRWEEALLHLQQARRLDPRSLAVANNLQNTLMWMRRYPEALAASEVALAIAPGDLSVSQDKAMIFVAQGDLAGARAVIKQVSPTVPAPALAGFFALYWDMYWVLDEDLQQVLLRLGPSAFDDDRTAWGAALMQTWWARGDRVKARAYADSALVSSTATLAKSPDDPQRNALHGLILGYLGRKAEAIVAGERAISISTIGRDGINGPYMQHQLARTYLLVGEPERALDMLEPLLKVPYYLSPGWLRIDPTFAELKGNPRYDRLVRGS
jgi:tetratricopeptide (TPR) repeat protein